MKKMSLLALGITILSLSFIQADDEFEIFSKASKPIWYRLENGGKSQWRKLESHDEQSIVGLPLELKTTLEIYTTDPGDRISAKELRERRPDQVYTFTPKKKIYVTWGDTGILRPQTGTQMGLSRTTRSGKSLKDNVTTNDIRLVTP